MANADPNVSTRGLEALAIGKMEKVLGPERARALFDRLTAEHSIRLRTPQDLLRFADALTAMGGIEGAVGAMLGVAAVLQGATRT